MKEKTLCKFTCNRVFSFQAYAYGESRTHEQEAKQIANDICRREPAHEQGAKRIANEVRSKGLERGARSKADCSPGIANDYKL